MTFSDFSHYMTEVHSTIEIRFGNPSCEKKQKKIEDGAIEYGFSLEKMLLYDFERCLNETWIRKEGDSIFQLFSIYLFDTHVKNPKVSFGTYKFKDTLYPKLVFDDDYLDKSDSVGRIWMSDEMIKKIGKEIDENFDYEYVDFQRIKK
jgi:hypothetical protein